MSYPVHIRQSKHTGRLCQRSDALMNLSQQWEAANNKYSNEIQRRLKRYLWPFNLWNSLSLEFIFISGITRRKHSGNVKFRIRTKQPTDFSH